MSDGYKEMVASREHWDAKREAEIESLRSRLNELREAAGKVKCLRCGGVGKLARDPQVMVYSDPPSILWSAPSYDWKHCPDCADLRVFLKETAP